MAVGVLVCNGGCWCLGMWGVLGVGMWAWCVVLCVVGVGIHCVGVGVRVQCVGVGVGVSR